jgi:hypothetical protein
VIPTAGQPRSAFLTVRRISSEALALRQRQLHCAGHVLAGRIPKAGSGTRVSSKDGDPVTLFGRLPGTDAPLIEPTLSGVPAGARGADDTASTTNSVGRTASRYRVRQQPLHRTLALRRPISSPSNRHMVPTALHEYLYELIRFRCQVGSRHGFRPQKNRRLSRAVMIGGAMHDMCVSDDAAPLHRSHTHEGPADSGLLA